MVRSKFYEDKRKEELFGRYLDKNFYSALNAYSSQRVYEKDLQKKGVDLILEDDQGEHLVVDEKAALHYMHTNINTFAFEIFNTNSGNPGWLYNPNYLTSHYLLAWPHATDTSVPSSDVFCNNEVMLISRKDIHKILADRGLDQEKILDIFYSYEHEWSRTESFWRKDFGNGITLYFTKWLKEQPVNVLISKAALKKHAILHKVVG